MVKMITLTRQVAPAARPSALGSAELALATGGAEASTSVMKSQHDTAKAVIGNLR